ncbi:MAG TPA: hypothetical protein VEC18_03270, partial [Myxococcota bacterium]|nr:hypothetical protein [Myxococcota bacterium]
MSAADTTRNPSGAPGRESSREANLDSSRGPTRDPNRDPNCDPSRDPNRDRNRSWTLLELLRWTTDHFAARGIETPRLDAECLL